MTGTLYGVGVGPGDPELITLKAVRILRSVPAIAYPAPLDGDGMARRLAAAHLPGGQDEIVMRMAFDPRLPPPDEAYDRGAAAIAVHLAAGRDVAVLCEGDPLFFGSFAYVMERLDGRFPVEVVPGVASPMACASVLRRPLTTRDEALAIVPATRGEAEIEAALAGCEAGVVMKLGRHLAKVRRVLDRLGLDGTVVAWAGHAEQRIMTLDEAAAEGTPYFSMLLVRRCSDPSPACGRGRGPAEGREGEGGASADLQMTPKRDPHPDPPPRAGEGA